MILKIVTLQEANTLLPLVREHFFRIHSLIAKLYKLKRGSEEGVRMAFRIDRRKRFISIYKKTIKSKRHKELEKKLQDIENMLEKETGELLRYGAVIKSFFPPHIDFLSVKNNELIYLCWHGQEEQICYWHQLDDGSPMRLCIEQDHGFPPMVVH